MSLSKLTGGGGSATPTTTANKMPVVVTTFLEENRFLECHFCERTMGVQTRATGLYSCYPGCGGVADSGIDTLNLREFLRDHEPIRCHRCQEPMGFKNLTKRRFYCSPRCHQGRNVAVPTGITVPLATTHASGNAIPPALTSVQAASGVEVKQEAHSSTKFGTMTVVSSSSSSSLANDPAPLLPVVAPTSKAKAKKGKSLVKKCSVKIETSQRRRADDAAANQGTAAKGAAKEKKTKRIRQKSRFNYPCHSCGEIFNDSHALRRHEYRHMSSQEQREERKKWPIQCLVCSCRFRYKSDLVKHLNCLRVHKKL